MLQGTIWKILEYPMMVTSISKEQWGNIIQPVIQTTLPKMGFVLFFPRELIFASKENQGINIHHPFYWQVITQINILCKHFTSDTTTEELLRRE